MQRQSALSITRKEKTGQQSENTAGPIKINLEQFARCLNMDIRAPTIFRDMDIRAPTIIRAQRSQSKKEKMANDNSKET